MLFLILLVITVALLYSWLVWIYFLQCGCLSMCRWSLKCSCLVKEEIECSKFP